MTELITDFHNAVDHYLDVCQQRGEKLQKTYSGKLTLRISPDTHADIAVAAAHTGKASTNGWKKRLSMLLRPSEFRSVLEREVVFLARN